MADQTVEVVIKARDGSSQTFKAIANSADTMGKSVTDAATKSGRSLKSLEDSAKRVGAGFGALVTATALAGRASVDAERQIDGLRRTYGETADDILEFTEALQDSTNFSNDAGREAALVASTLARSYGLTGDQIEILISRSADLATVYGTTLADAVSRTAGAIRGEGEAAEALGLTLSDSAVAAEAAARGLSGWTTTMTEAEKAAFRYTLLLEQSASLQGAATDAAEGTRGRMVDLSHAFDDAVESIGAWTGETGQALSVLGDLALAAPLAGAGLGKVSSGALALAGALGRLPPFLGPVGLIAGGVAALAVAAIGDHRKHQQAVEELERAYGDLRETIVALPDLGFTPEQTLAASANEALLKQVEALGELAVAVNMVNEFAGSGGQILFGNIDPGAMGLHTESVLYLADSLSELALDETRAAEASALISEALTTQGIDVDSVNQHIGFLLGQYEIWVETNGRLGLSGQSVVEYLEWMNEHVLEFGSNTVDLIATQEKQAKVQAQIAAHYEAEAKALAQLNIVKTAYNMRSVESARAGTLGLDAANKQLRAFQIGLEWQYEALLIRGKEIPISIEAARAQEKYRFATEGATAQLAIFNAASEGAAEMSLVAAQAYGSSADRVDEWNAAVRDATAAAIAFVGEAGNIDDVLLGAGADLPGNQGALRMVQDVARSKAQLDSLFSVVASTPQALGQSISAVADWSEALTGPGKQFGEIDRALSTGRISLAEYNAALDANTVIAENNEAAQSHLTAIMAKQLPFISGFTDSYEDYLQTISELPAAEQRLALAFLDSGTQAEIAGSYATAYAASLGEIPEEVASAIIISDAEANPALKGVLEKYGLIEEDANGEIHVRFPEARTITDAVDGLTDSVDALTTALGGVPPSVHTDVTLTDYASAGIENVRALLSSLDGTTATTYIQTLAIGGGAENLNFQHGGVVGNDIARAQHGLATGRLSDVWVGEAGPELVKLPAGSYVQPAPASRHQRGHGGGGDIHIHGPITLVAQSPDLYDALYSQLARGGRR